MERYVEPHWIVDYPTAQIRHFQGGYLTPGEVIPASMYDVIIPSYYIPELVQFLTDKGYVKPTMTNGSREEDLKIVHRLLDLMEKK